MKTITLTDAEFAVAKRAVEAFNDMQNDCVLEQNIEAINLFPTDGGVQTITATGVLNLRNEINKAIDQMVTISKLCNKLNIKINDAGYCE